jgi:hypothetical protein
MNRGKKMRSSGIKTENDKIDNDDFLDIAEVIPLIST